MRKLGRTTAQRKAMLRGMVTLLLETGKIETTYTRAQEVSAKADEMITLGKKGDLAAYRTALEFITKEDVAKKLGKMDVLVQGTIYPDIVESGVGGHKAVKAHHNVGGLPKDMGFEGLVEPVKYLYKDEVRKVGKELGIPEPLVMRQPFPGPGLAVRCLGELTKEKLDILRQADFIFRDEMAKAKLDRKAQQFFAIMTNVKSVGVKNGARTFGYVIGIRAVSTSQFVKAGVVELPFKFVTMVAEKIATKVKGANRVVWDITPKPPATIEWE